MLTREEILSKKTLKRERVMVDEFGGEVLVRELSGKERALYESSFVNMADAKDFNTTQKPKHFEQMRAKVISLAVINEDGSWVFKDEDVPDINELSGAALDTIASVIMRLSGYTKRGAKKNLSGYRRFCLRLALACNRLDVDEMLDEISSSQLAEWEQYATEEPFGQIRQDMLLGSLVQLVYNAFRGEDSPPLTLQDILYPKPAEDIVTVDADLAFVEALIASGKVVDMRQRKLSK